MWFKLVVVGLKAAGQKPKTAEVFCSFSTEGCPAVHDAALAQFCWPLGPENQTPKEFMAPEVSGGVPYQCRHTQPAYTAGDDSCCQHTTAATTLTAVAKQRCL